MQTYRLHGPAPTGHRRARREWYHPLLVSRAPDREVHPEFLSGIACEEEPEKGVALFLYHLGRRHPRVTEDQIIVIK